MRMTQAICAFLSVLFAEKLRFRPHAHVTIPFPARFFHPALTVLPVPAPGCDLTVRSHPVRSALQAACSRLSDCSGLTAHTRTPDCSAPPAHARLSDHSAPAAHTRTPDCSDPPAHARLSDHSAPAAHTRMTDRSDPPAAPAARPETPLLYSRFPPLLPPCTFLLKPVWPAPHGGTCFWKGRCICFLPGDNAL